MSVRAYKIKHIEYEEEPTFNLWHDGFIANNSVVDYSTTSGGETAEAHIQQESIQNLLKDFEKEWKEYTGEDKTPKDKKYYKEVLKKMLEDCKENGGYTDYICF